MKEYYVKYWGQASGFLKEKLEVNELDFWFNHEISRQKHIDKCLNLCKDVGTIVYDCREGEDMDFKTVVEMNLVYNGVKHPYTYDFGYGYPCSSAEYMFFEGNYACDCNLSDFIRKSNVNFPELDCGDTISVEDFKITKVRGDLV